MKKQSAIRIIPREPSKVKRFLLIFYLVGSLGFMIPQSRDIFIELTKWALLLNFFLLLWFHRGPVNTKTVLVFILIYFTGFIIEAIGVETGMIFGHYTYGSGLGIKIFHTPLMIGINWLMLSYCFANLAEHTGLGPWPRMLLGAAGMVIYDLVLEQSAPFLDLWSWKNGIIPLENYLAWFFLALIFQAILVLGKVKTKNPLAPVLLLCQFCFFLLLTLYNLFVL